MTVRQDRRVSVDLDPAQCLIVVDMQQGFLHGVHAIPDTTRLIDRVSWLLSHARQAGALVVHLQNDGAVGAIDEPDTPGWNLCLAPNTSSDNEVVLRKTDDDGFTGTGLKELLESRGVRRVAIAGVLSEMCVSATARGALACGLSVVLPRDAHGTYDLEDIPAAVVARVAEHALGDQPELADSTAVAFTAAHPHADDEYPS